MKLADSLVPLASLGKPARASDESDPDHPPSCITDGSDSEWWTRCPAAWVEVDLQEDVLVHEVRIQWWGSSWASPRSRSSPRRPATARGPGCCSAAGRRPPAGPPPASTAGLACQAGAAPRGAYGSGCSTGTSTHGSAVTTSACGGWRSTATPQRAPGHSGDLYWTCDSASPLVQTRLNGHTVKGTDEDPPGPGLLQELTGAPNALRDTALDYTAVLDVAAPPGAGVNAHHVDADTVFLRARLTMHGDRGGGAHEVAVPFYSGEVPESTVQVRAAGCLATLNATPMVNTPQNATQRIASIFPGMAPASSSVIAETVTAYTDAEGADLTELFCRLDAYVEAAALANAPALPGANVSQVLWPNVDMLGPAAPNVSWNMPGGFIDDLGALQDGKAVVLLDASLYPGGTVRVPTQVINLLWLICQDQIGLPNPVNQGRARGQPGQHVGQIRAYVYGSAQQRPLWNAAPAITMGTVRQLRLWLENHGQGKHASTLAFQRSAAQSVMLGPDATVLPLPLRQRVRRDAAGAGGGVGRYAVRYMEMVVETACAYWRRLTTPGAPAGSEWSARAALIMGAAAWGVLPDWGGPVPAAGAQPFWVPQGHGGVALPAQLVSLFGMCRAYSGDADEIWSRMTFAELNGLTQLLSDASLGANGFAAVFEPLQWFAGAAAPAILGGRGPNAWAWSRLFNPEGALHCFRTPGTVTRFVSSNLKYLVSRINNQTRGALPEERNIWPGGRGPAVKVKQINLLRYVPRDSDVCPGCSEGIWRIPPDARDELLRQLGSGGCEVLSYDLSRLGPPPTEAITRPLRRKRLRCGGCGELEDAAALSGQGSPRCRACQAAPAAGTPREAHSSEAAAELAAAGLARPGAR
ncbi:unnamed protein product [Prorocentrum cordatum]|uniref:F5/8 type C domain-containing protein n=1 Tax=Prorocentrum cordatum TaxID=2364126 RepID=A0ABN9SZN2_9DINO|nr:unnamed protein product [Polarella glacialis]